MKPTNLKVGNFGAWKALARNAYPDVRMRLDAGDQLPDGEEAEGRELHLRD